MNSNLILSPVKTEKSMKDAQSNSFTFWININASKPQIKEVVEKLFGVNVVEVRTTRLAGKSKRFKKHTLRLGDRKKAIVTLKKGQSINLFETEKKNKKGAKKK